MVRTCDTGCQMPVHFRPEVSGEREQGRVCALKESFGFVRCMDRPGDLFFHLTEAPPNINIGDEVDFFIGMGNRYDLGLGRRPVVLYY